MQENIDNMQNPSCADCSGCAGCPAEKRERLTVKVFGGGTQLCERLATAAESAVEELDRDIAFERVSDSAKAAFYGVKELPALVVNSKIVPFGKFLNKSAIIKLLQDM